MSLIRLVQEDNNLHFSYYYYRGNKRGTYYSKCIIKEKRVGKNEVVHLIETFMDTITIHVDRC